MGIEAQFSMNDVRRKLEADLIKINRLIFLRLSYLGEMCVNHARTMPAQLGYTDRTGALRASTGYAIYANGQQVKADFTSDTAGDGSKTTEGKAAGISIANNVAQTHTKGWVLVVVAGMNYAVYVEATGRDVLTSAEQLAREAMPAMIQDLTKQVSKI